VRTYGSRYAISRSSAVSFTVRSTPSSASVIHPKTLFCGTLKTGKSPHGRSSYASGNDSASAVIRSAIVFRRTERILTVCMPPPPGTGVATRKGGRRMGKTIREAMTSNPKTVSTDQSVVDAARIMKEEDAGIVPIVDGQKLVGV